MSKKSKLQLPLSFAFSCALLTSCGGSESSAGGGAIVGNACSNLKLEILNSSSSSWVDLPASGIYDHLAAGDDWFTRPRVSGCTTQFSFRLTNNNSSVDCAIDSVSLEKVTDYTEGPEHPTFSKEQIDFTVMTQPSSNLLSGDSSDFIVEYTNTHPTYCNWGTLSSRVPAGYTQEVVKLSVKSADNDDMLFESSVKIFGNS